MESSKIDRIKKLDREVDDFHPLLNSLFAKIPSIRSFEYTQGPKEMGADFVLERYDEALLTTVYIGVIVKVGKIKQDHAEIERQISECGIERTFNGGKRKIYITEIWVINNDSITDGAQQKIYHNHKNTSIHFFDVQKITTLIDKYYPEYWTDISIKLGQYLRETLAFSAQITKNSSILELHDNTIIEQKLIAINSKIRPDQGRRKKEIHLTIGEIINREDLIFVEGAMGAGKSNLLKRAIERLTQPEVLNSEKIIPITKTFKEYYEKHSKNPKEIITTVEQATNTCTNEYQYIIMLDGLDEVSISTDEKLKALCGLSQFVRETHNVKALVTSRPIDDPKERLEISKNYSRFNLCLLSTKQLISFVRKICENEKALEKLTNGIEKTPLFKSLPKTPISAILLAKILKEDPAELPSTMTELYSKYVELVLGRWDMSKGLQSQKEYDIINNVCIDIGSYIIDNNLDCISAGEAKSFFVSYIGKRNIKICPDSIFDKFISKREIISFFSRNQTIQFKHRTFAEFFSAKKLARDNSAVLDEKIFDSYWATSFFFYVGLKRDCPQLIDAISNIKTTSTRHEITRVFHTGSYLLAGYLTPYESISNGVSQTYKKAANLIIDALENRSPLARLPRMQVIYIITHGLTYSFGYEYFQEAIQNSAMSVMSIKNPSETDLVELFLLNSTHGYLGSNDAFDTLISEHAKELPNYLQLGIQHITNDFKLNSQVTSKFIKRLQKNMRSKGNISELLTQLYDTPISKVDNSENI